MRSKKNSESWRIKIRSNWELVHFIIIGFVSIMLLYSAFSITTNETAMDAKETLDFCSFSKLSTGQCIEAQNKWDNAIDTAWSLSAIGVLIASLTIFKYERKDQFDKWPSDYREEE